MVNSIFITQPIITFNGEALPWQAFYLSGLASTLKASQENDEWWFAFCVCLGRTRNAPAKEVLFHSELLQKAVKEQVSRAMAWVEVTFRYEQFEARNPLPEYDPLAVVEGCQHALDRIHVLAPQRDPCEWSGVWDPQSVRMVDVPEDFYLRPPEDEA